VPPIFKSPLIWAIVYNFYLTAAGASCSHRFLIRGVLQPMTKIRLAEKRRKSGFILALLVSKWQANQH
jgi:hypothetical protein